MRRPDPLATAILGGIAAFVAGGLVWAHATEPDRSGQACGECSPPAIVVAPGAVWVAQGNLIHRFDPATGVRSPAVDAWPADGHHVLQAITVDRGRVLVAWDGGVGILRGDRVVRHTIRPALRGVLFVHGRDRAYVLGSRRLVALRADGSPGTVRRFRTRGLAEVAARRIARGPLPPAARWDDAFGVTAGEYRAQRGEDLIVRLTRRDPVSRVARWSVQIPVS